MTRRMLMFQELREHGVLIGRRQVFNLECQGKFPRRVPISENRVGWIADEIEAWVNARIESRSTRLGTVGSHRDDASRPLQRRS